jgi:hypothetical protein
MLGDGSNDKGKSEERFMQWTFETVEWPEPSVVILCSDSEARISPIESSMRPGFPAINTWGVVKIAE